MENWFSLIVFSVYNYLYNIAKDLPLNKQSVILAGPSGCGKTETYRCLKRYFKKEIPKLVVDLVDMNQITCEGFSGNNTEFLVQGLKRGRSKGIGILFGDEFDKRISPIYSSHGDNVNREIQGQLLLPIEGCIIDNVDTPIGVICSELQIVVMYMNEIEKIKHEVQMNEWSRQVMSWRESGLSATAWCKRENIPCSTFFYRERKVREFLVNDIRKDECCFEQLPVLPIPQTRDVKQAITISVNGLDINISNGTNEETIAAVLRAVKSAW